MSDKPVDWNNEPWIQEASPEIKAMQFDLQIEQNEKNPPPPVIDPQIKHG